MTDSPLTINQLRACLAMAAAGTEPTEEVTKDACTNHDADYHDGLVEVVRLLQHFARTAVLLNT